MENCRLRGKCSGSGSDSGSGSSGGGGGDSGCWWRPTTESVGPALLRRHRDSSRNSKAILYWRKIGCQFGKLLSFFLFFSSSFFFLPASGSSQGANMKTVINTALAPTCGPKKTSSNSRYLPCILPSIPPGPQNLQLIDPLNQQVGQGLLFLVEHHTQKTSNGQDGSPSRHCFGEYSFTGQCY